MGSSSVVSGRPPKELYKNVVADIQDGAGTSVMDTTNNAIQVNIVAGSSSGTEYTEDAAAPANPAAGAQALVRLDTPVSLTTADNDIVIRRGTDYGAAYTQILDSSGNYVDTFGGGTQYTEDAGAAANPVGNTQMLVADSTPALEVDEGDNVARRGTRYGAAYAQIVDSSGAFVDTFGGGTQYTEGATDATITGTAALAEGPSDTLTTLQVDASKHLQVDIAADSVGIGGGTQYTDDTDVHATGTTKGTAVIAAATPTDGSVEANDLGVVAMSLDRRLHVDADITAQSGAALDVSGATVTVDGSGVTQPVSGTFWQGTQPVSAAALPLPSGAATSAKQLADGHNVTVDNAAGASAVNIQDGGNTITVDGTITADAGTNLNTSALALDATLTGVIGTDGGAGPANVVSIGGTNAGNIQEIAVDATGNLQVDIVADAAGLALAANQLGDGHNVTVDNAGGGSAVNIQDGGNAITVDAANDGSLVAQLGDGTSLATVRNLAANDALNVAIVDGSGDQITTFGGGTQYTEDDGAVANPTGTMPVLVRDDTPNTQTDTDGDVIAQRATNYGAAYVQVVDSSGNFIDTFGGSGGTAVADDSTFTAGSGQGTPAMGFFSTDVVDAGDVGVLAMDASRRLFVSLEVDNVGLATSAGQLADGHNVTVDNASIAVTHTGLTDLAAAINTNELDVNIATDSVGIGGGTQYAVDAPLGATPTGTLALARRDDTLTTLTPVEDDAIALRVGQYGDLWVSLATKLDSTNDSITAVGDIAHDTADSGNPVKIGGKAYTTLPAAAATLDRVDQTMTTQGGALVAGIDGTTPRNIAVNASGQLEVDITAQQLANLQVQSNSAAIATETTAAAILADTATMDTSLVTLADWDNAASDGASVSGDVAHDTADAGEPVKVGHKAVSFGSDPTEVAANDRTDWYSTRAGVPFTIGGHPNVITKHLNITDADGAQTDTNVLNALVGANDVAVLTHITVTADNANTGDVQCRIGWGAANTPGNDAVDVVLSHPGIPAGGGVSIGNGAGILGMGASGEELRMTCEDPAGGSLDVVVGYFIIDNS